MDKNSNAVKRGRLGGLTTASRHDTITYTAPGLERMNSLARWLEQIPEGLPEEERVRRAEALKTLNYVRLGIRSGEARRAKNSTKRGTR